MIKILVTLITILLSSNCVMAQSVLGIKFGSSYDDVLGYLSQRFGKYNVHKNETGLTVYNCKLGDVSFHLGEFGFQYDNNNSYFNSATFQIHYELSESNAAKDTRDYIFSLLKEKYEDEYIEEYTNDEGYKCYKFGVNPFDEDMALGLITLERAKGKDGKSRLYVLLEYLPIYYLPKSSDF